MIYDSIVIGKGPAGIQSALYMKRANLNILVIGKDGGSLEKAGKIENFYGQENEVSGKELISKGILQVEKMGVQVLSEEVVGLENFENNSENQSIFKINKEQSTNSKFLFKVKTLKNEYISKSVIVATGTNRRMPSIKGVEKFEGRGVSYCAVCDGFFYKDKEIAVIGNGDFAISEVEVLLPVTNKITILTNGKDEVLTRNESVSCNTKKIAEITGDTKVEKVIFKDNTEMNVSGVFIAEGVATSVDFARKLGADTEENKLVVDDKSMETNVSGLFAAGDCTGEVYQISKAIYEGMKAGLSVIKYLKQGK